MTIKNHRCDQLGVCQGLGPDQCPDCDSDECEVACQPRLAEMPRPTFPFAPGVIQGPELPIIYVDADGPWFPLSLAQMLKLAGVMAVLGLAAGYLVERYA